MPTILGPRFSPDWGGRPARMSAEDLEIWRRYWPAAMGDALGVYFDVGLGLPDNLPQVEDANQLLGWIRNTQKRADVVVDRPEIVEIIELRFNASANALGRLELYLMLWGDDNPLRKQTRGVLVTDREDSELRRAALARGITFVVA